jgi:hypothetical protein
VDIALLAQTTKILRGVEKRAVKIHKIRSGVLLSFIPTM